MGDIWWACDMRAFRLQGSVVVRSSNSWFRHGFSCRNRAAAMAALKKALSSAGVLEQVAFVADVAVA